MGIKSFNDISFNYYLNTATYVKTILDILPESEVSNKKKAVIMELFNLILNSQDKSKIDEVLQLSRKFDENLALSSNNEIMLQANYIYSNFLEKMLFDSFNREIYFQIMNECVKVYCGYYHELENDNIYELNDYKVDNIRVR